MKILITAPPKTGKSTVLRKLIEILPPELVSGLITEEMVERGKRVGFKTKVINSNHEFQIARIALLEREKTLGKWKIDIENISKSIDMAIDRIGPIFILDEIGRMQSYSPFFLDKAYELMSKCDNAIIIATIVYEDELFSRRFKEITDVKITEVTLENRDVIVSEIYALLKNI